MEENNNNIKNGELLDKYFSKIKEEKYDSSFIELENWLRNRETYPIPTPNKFKIFKNFIFVNKMKFAYLIVAFVITGITSNFTVSQNDTVGNVVTWKIDKQNKEAIEKIDKFDWLDKSQLVVSESKDDNSDILVYKLIIPTENRQSINTYKSELAALNEIKSLEVIPISETVKIPLYAAAMNKVFNWNMNQKFVNAEEIRQSVFDQLRNAGIENEVDIYESPEIRSNGYVNVQLKPLRDSLRIKVHIDAVKELNMEKIRIEVEDAMKEVQDAMKELHNNLGKKDSVLKRIIIKRMNDNSEDITIDVNEILRTVNKSLDSTLKIFKNKEFLKDLNEENFNNLESLKELENLKYLEGLDTLGEFIEKEIKINFDRNGFDKLDSLNMNFDKENFKKKIKVMVDSVKNKTMKINIEETDRETGNIENNIENEIKEKNKSDSTRKIIIKERKIEKKND